MTASSFTPEFRLKINGENVPSGMRASTSSVNLQLGLEGASRLELSLVNESLRWLDHPLLALDKEITLSLGYTPEPLKQVFVGEIVSHQAEFPSTGMPMLTVVAQDRIRRLQEGTKTRWFAIPIASVGNYALPDTAVAGIIGAENLLIPILDPVGASISILLGGIQAIVTYKDPDAGQKVIRHQAEESDFDFLKRVCAENSWEMLIDHSAPQGGYKLHFLSALDHLTPEVKLRYGQSLIGFSPRISNVGQLASVTALIWISQIKTQFAVTVGYNWDRQSLELEIKPSFSPTKTGASDVVIEEPVTAVSAPREIISRLIPKLNQRLTGSGSCIGNPKILPGTVLQLEGLGTQFGGLYRVTSATHIIDSNGYRTQFEVRKEIWFGSIPLNEQGAVPIGIRNPLSSLAGA
jgi:hypothetical protein